MSPNRFWRVVWSRCRAWGFPGAKKAVTRLDRFRRTMRWTMLKDAKEETILETDEILF